MNRSIRLIELHEETRDALSVQVKIDHGEILKVVVRDLFSKYKSCCDRRDEKNAKAFNKVLRYYITEKEFDNLISGLSVEDL